MQNQHIQHRYSQNGLKVDIPEKQFSAQITSFFEQETFFEKLKVRTYRAWCRLMVEVGSD